MPKSNPVTVAEILTLAMRAEQSGQPNVAEALHAVSGRMDRGFGSDCYDKDTPEDEAVARSYRRANRASFLEKLTRA